VSGQDICSDEIGERAAPGVMTRVSMDQPTVLDLFCGAGGLSEGFQRAGFKILGGVDNDPTAIESFSANHPESKAICADIREVSSVELMALGEPDVLIGGPSCQGFSTHGKRIAEDPRNFLFREFVRVTRDLTPKWVVIENVKGMLWYDKGAFRTRIHEAFEELGYRIASKVLLAADYGVPQMRERIFFIGTRTDAPVTFPEPTHGTNEVPWLAVDDAISDLPSLGLGGGDPAVPYLSPPITKYQQEMREGSDYLTLHTARPVSARALSIIRRIPQGKGIRHLPEEELPERFRRMRTISNGRLRRDCTTLYHRLDPNRPSYTITCYFTNVSSGPFVHPYDDRAISPREAGRLQSFSDRYVFAPRALPRQIGNAVPPLLARAVASVVLSAIRGEIESADEAISVRQLAFA
jgi:DNA (cytosine-5)-methyltransferase 1